MLTVKPEGYLRWKHTIDRTDMDWVFGHVGSSEPMAIDIFPGFMCIEGELIRAQPHNGSLNVSVKNPTLIVEFDVPYLSCKVFVYIGSRPVNTAMIAGSLTC